MKRVFVYLVACLFLMTACTPKTLTEPPSLIIEQPSDLNPTPKPTELPVDLTPAQSAAVSLLSGTLNLPVEQIALISTEAVTWPDGCLGVKRDEMMCTQALVEGFKITLEVGGNQYEMHTDQDGSAVVLAMDLPMDGLIESALIAQLAINLGLNQSDISVVSSEKMEFADACLGVVMQGVMCAEVITPGYVVVLEVGGIQYEYHVSDDGRLIQPATLALTWKREGGFVGFCDSLTVFLSGEVYGNQCKSQPNGTMGTFATLLSPDEKDQFTAWIEDYGSVTLDASDPKGTADGMTNEVVLFGNGKGKPGKPVEGDIFTWAQELFQKLYN